MEEINTYYALAGHMSGDVLQAFTSSFSLITETNPPKEFMESHF